MAELTLEQKRAVALARARVRAKQATPPAKTSIEDQISQTIQKASEYRHRPNQLSTPAFEQGLTQQFGDELAGLARGTRAMLPESFNPGGKGFSELYSEGRDKRLAELKQYHEENPVSAQAQEIGGSIISGGAFKKGAGALATTFEKLPKWLQTTGLGALWGAADSVGRADPGERLEAAGEGAAMGAATGSILHGGGKVLGGLGKGTRAYAKALFRPQAQADRLLANALGADEVTRMQQRLKVLGPNATIMDIGDETTKGLARGVAGVPGRSRRQITSTLTSRSKGSQGRLEREVRKKIGPTDYFDAEETFLAKLREGADANYGAAREAYPTVMSDSLREKLQSPSVRKGLREALEIAQNRVAAGKNAPVDEIEAALKDPEKVQALSLDAWDYVKRGLDALVEKPAYSNQFTGRVNARGGSIKGLTKSLLKDLDNATGGASGPYAHARKAYGGDAEMVGALRDGKNFMKLAPEEIKRAMAKLSASGKEAYRSGAARAVQDVLTSTRGKASPSNRLFGASINKSKIAQIFPEKEFSSFRRSVQAEQVFDETRNAVVAGSRTAPMMEDVANVKRQASRIGALVGSAFPIGGHALVKAGVGRQLGSEAIGSTPKVMTALAKMLSTQSRTEQLAILQRIAPDLANRPEYANALIRGLTAAATGAGQQPD